MLPQECVDKRAHRFSGIFNVVLQCTVATLQQTLDNAMTSPNYGQVALIDSNYNYLPNGDVVVVLTCAKFEKKPNYEEIVQQGYYHRDERNRNYSPIPQGRGRY